jgi:hypothetical protein
MGKVVAGGAMIKPFMIQSMCHELATSGKVKFSSKSFQA